MSSLLVILFIFLAMGLSGLYFESEIRSFAQWMVDHFGIWGMAGFLFFSDTFISPIPPDLFLLVIAKSNMRESWWIYVSILAVVSTLAGHFGWLCGRMVVESRFFPTSIRNFFLTKQALVKRYGTWAVILGALTPLPFSVTCWTAGILKMPYQRFALAVSSRFIRIYVYYLAIHFSDWVKVIA